LEHNSYFFLMLFLISFTLAALATPIISKFAYSNKIVDQPGLHKTHFKPKPLLGGLAIFIGFSVTMLYFLDVDDKLLSLSAATVVLILTGLLDDIYNLKPLHKLTGQTISALIVVLWNRGLFVFMLDYFERFYIPNVIVLIMITGWIVLMINAFNLIDGLDGLAAGAASIIFLAMAVLSWLTGGNPNILGVQLIGLGACLGFLIFNFNPAKIFMGDTGNAPVISLGATTIWGTATNAAGYVTVVLYLKQIEVIYTMYFAAWGFQFVRQCSLYMQLMRFLPPSPCFYWHLIYLL